MTVGIYCCVAVCSAVVSAARGASAPTEGGEGRGHIVPAARLQLVIFSSFSLAFLSDSVRWTNLVAVGVQILTDV